MYQMSGEDIIGLIAIKTGVLSDMFNDETGQVATLADAIPAAKVIVGDLIELLNDLEKIVSNGNKASAISDEENVSNKTTPYESL